MSDHQSCSDQDKNFTKIVKLIETTIPSYDEKPELFKKLLDDEFDIHYRVPDSVNDPKSNWMVGCTIFEIIYDNTEMAKMLIDRGADFTIKDKEGSSNLHLVANLLYKFRLSSLKSRKHCKEECYADIVLSAHINSKNSTNPTDKTGLSHFHIACIYNRADAAKFFLENGVLINESVNQDSEYFAGFSALHFAVKSRAFETVDLLLTMGADLFAKDTKGMNPLHVLMVDRKETFVKLRRCLRIARADYQNANYLSLHNCYTEYEKLVFLLLERMNRCSDDTELSYFHVLCFMGNTCKIHDIFQNNRESMIQSVIKDSPIWPGYTPLHFAANCSAEVVEFLLKQGADLSAKDAKGVTPFDICLREFAIADVNRILSLQPDYFNITFYNSKTKLGDFIHAMQDSTTFENFLKDNVKDPNMFIPFDAPVCAGYTPLHLAVMCIEQPMSWSSENPDHPYDLFRDLESKESQNYVSRIESYLRYNPDVTTRDARGSTPLHWAFRLQQSKAVHLLLDRHETSSNYVDEHGLSHLHIACAADNVAVVKKLLEGGANVNGIANSSYTWINVKVGYTTEISYRGRAPKHSINENSTPLHFAVTARCTKVVEILVAHDADVLTRDAKGYNPLESILETRILDDVSRPKSNRERSLNEVESKVMELIARRIAVQLADTKPRNMLCYYSLMEDKLLSEILSHNTTHNDESSTKILATAGITPLHVACFTRNSLQVQWQLANKNDVNARVDSESPLWPGCTPLHLFTKQCSGHPLDSGSANRTIVDKLLLRGADVIARNVDSNTPIHQIFHHNWYHLGKLLEHLKDFGVNPMGDRGLNHLHIASACGAVSTVEKLLEHGAMVDQPTDYFTPQFGAFTALHLAAHHRQNDVIEVLLKRGANVNWRNSSGGNSLHSANGEDRKPCLDVLQTLIDAGADIHARNMYGDTPLEALIKAYQHTEEEVELFVTSGSHVNCVNPMSEDRLLALILNKGQDLPFFEMAIKASDIKNTDENGRNAIHNVVTFKRPDWTAINYHTIDDTYTSSDEYIKGIGSLLKLRLNINQQDRKGLTPLHVAAQMQNLTGIIGLLENGADINLTDAEGKPAFAYSLELAQLHEKLMELDLRILKVIAIHMHKLNIARIGICKANKAVFSKLRRKIIQLVKSGFDVYPDEIERMTEEQVYSTAVTLREFFSDTWAVSAFPYLLSCKQMAIDYYFKNEIANLRENFPEFTGILLLQYRKALARSDMISRAVTSLNHLAGFDVPAICSRMILSFLSNDELSNMISSRII